MKIAYIVLAAFIVLTSCQKEEKLNNIFKNHLSEFQSEKKQIFDLDTIPFKLIKGKNDTKIYFNRADFDISKDQKITLELIELYDFKEVLFRNMSTVTTQNKLLETNGVLFIEFKSKGKTVKLKEGKILKVIPLKERLDGNDIFIAKTDSLKNTKWLKTRQDYITVESYKGGGITVIYEIHQDSLESFRRREDQILESKKEIQDFFVIENGNFGWINIDRVVDVDFELDFSINTKTLKHNAYNIYFTYTNLKSFVKYCRDLDSLSFNKIPVKGKTWMTILTEKDGNLLYDKIEMKKKLNSSKITLNLKKITKEKLGKLLLSN